MGTVSKGVLNSNGRVAMPLCSPRWWVLGHEPVVSAFAVDFAATSLTARVVVKAVRSGFDRTLPRDCIACALLQRGCLEDSDLALSTGAVGREIVAHEARPQSDSRRDPRVQLAPAGAFDGGLSYGFFLSARGYVFLGLETSGFASESFQKGMRNQKRRCLLQGARSRYRGPARRKLEPQFR
jgi:hypothetical protein